MIIDLKPFFIAYPTDEELDLGEIVVAHLVGTCAKIIDEGVDFQEELGMTGQAKGRAMSKIRTALKVFEEGEDWPILDSVEGSFVMKTARTSRSTGRGMPTTGTLVDSDIQMI